MNNIFILRFNPSNPRGDENDMGQAGENTVRIYARIEHVRICTLYLKA